MSIELRTRLAQLAYDCDGCGACCKRVIIEADHLDALREPRIVEAGRLMNGPAVEDSFWNLNSKGVDAACVFLGGDNQCGIYATRPMGCVRFQAGSTKCQTQRGKAGLPPLPPRKGTDSMADRLHRLAREDA